MVVEQAGVVTRPRQTRGRRVIGRHAAGRLLPRVKSRRQVGGGSVVRVRAAESGSV